MHATPGGVIRIVECFNFKNYDKTSLYFSVPSILRLKGVDGYIKKKTIISLILHTPS